MMSLAAAIKAGVVCMALLSPEVLFCQSPEHVDLVCLQDGCRTPRHLGIEWRAHPDQRAAFFRKLYGVEP